MDAEKRLILAIAFSVLVVIAYQNYTAKFYKGRRDLPAKSYQPGHAKETFSVSEKVEQPLRKDLVYETIQENLTVKENQLYRAVLSDRYGGIKEIYLQKFKDRNGKPILLTQSKENQPVILQIYDTIKGLPEGPWKLVKETDDEVAYIKDDAEKRLKKTIRFDKEKYLIEVTIEIENKLDLPQNLKYRLTGATSITAHSYVDNTYLLAEVEAAGKVHRRKPSSKKILGGEVFLGEIGWAGVKGRYFSLILKPQDQEKMGVIESEDRKNICAGVIMGPISIEPNGSIRKRFLLYAGPNTLESIKVLGPDAESIIYYGAFNSISILMLNIIKFFYNIFKNYGIAIISLSLLMSIILMPLTRKSLRSMKEMQRIQPEIENIRKEYADNPQKMNKEVMGLYKRHKINPLGGCLPMLLQFPIFIALYQVLIRSVELKGSGFLWIRDLSEPDAAFKLPYTLPIIGNNINVLPILMMLAMVVQQKTSQPKGAEASDQQRMMSILFPVIFGVVFYNLPSGLVLYWVINTSLMIIIQEAALKTSKPA